MRSADLISRQTRYFDLPTPLPLDCGTELSGITVAYRSWGRLAADGGNAVLVCHALTGSADVDRWWPALLGPGRALDPSRDFVVSSNVLGSCYGSTGPASLVRGCGHNYGPDFPPITVRDMVRLQARLLDSLGVHRLQLVIGGSLGGMQALEWAAGNADRVQAVVAIATSGRHSPWCIGLSEAQRAAIRADARWRDGRYPVADAPEAGLAAARMMAMCTYRSSRSFGDRFGRRRESGDSFASETYLQHHGRKLADRFDANAYITITRAMDQHDLARGRGAYREVLGGLPMPVQVVGISSDILYPPEEQLELARAIPGARMDLLDSPHGHDAFLIETEQLNQMVCGFRSGIGAGRCRLAS